MKMIKALTLAVEAYLLYLFFVQVGEADMPTKWKLIIEVMTVVVWAETSFLIAIGKKVLEKILEKIIGHLED